MIRFVLCDAGGEVLQPQLHCAAVAVQSPDDDRREPRHHPTDLRDAEAAINAATYRVAPTETLDVVEADATDNRILECAVASSSETIVSGDRHLLALSQFRGTSVLRVGDFLLRKIGRT